MTNRRARRSVALLPSWRMGVVMLAERRVAGVFHNVGAAFDDGVNRQYRRDGNLDVATTS